MEISESIKKCRVVRPSMALRRRLPVEVMLSFCATCGVTLMARRLVCRFSIVAWPM